MKVAARIIVAGMILLFQLSPARAEAPLRRVVLLSSFSHDISPSNAFISAFRTKLIALSPSPVDLQEIPLELARFTQPDQERAYAGFLRDRFSGRRPDLVVTVSPPAFAFIVRHRAAVFPESPLLVTGVAEQILRSGTVPENAATVPIRIQPEQMMAEMLEVMPGLKTVAVVFGVSSLGKYWAAQCRQAFAPFAARVDFVFLSHLPFSEMRRRLATLPPRSAVFFGVLVIDSEGLPIDTGEAVKTIAEEANAPVFSPFESYLGTGIVGGLMVNEKAVADQAAQIALRILGGEPAASFQEKPLSGPRSVYDWRALDRWRIDAKRLPPHAVIRFRQPSLWDRYRWHAAGAVLFMLLQSVLILRLIVQRQHRRQAESALRESEEKLRTITNSLPVLISYVDNNQRYRFNNDTYYAWFGISPEAAFGRTIAEVVGEGFFASVAPHVTKALCGEKVQFTQEVPLPDGKTITLEAVYVPDRDAGGQVRGIYILAMDVSERDRAQKESKRLYDELLHAGRITMMGELAGGLAHEINQPLSAIMSNAQAAIRFLSAPSPDIDEVREILPDIADEAGRAGDVINRLRAFLKKTTEVFEPVDLALIIQDVVRLLNSDAVIRNITIVTELDPRVPAVRGDRIQLQQVVLNLLTNAFDAMKNTPGKNSRVVIRTGLTGAEVATAITDNGPGIPAGETEMIFAPYYTSKPQGLGMGLSISRSIIASHRGRIWAENHSGGGAAFHFTLPIG